MNILEPFLKQQKSTAQNRRSVISALCYRIFASFCLDVSFGLEKLPYETPPPAAPLRCYGKADKFVIQQGILASLPTDTPYRFQDHGPLSGAFCFLIVGDGRLGSAGRSSFWGTPSNNRWTHLGGFLII